jgi:hypothetical protein
MVSSEQMSGVLSSPHSLRGSLRSNHIVSHSASLQETAELQGVLGQSYSLFGSLSGTQGLTADISIPEVTAADWYVGPYDVTPTTNIQMLFTEDKTLSDNVIVLAIPYSEVSNTSGGYTAVIG